MRTIIFFDIDGTILTETNQVPQSAVAAIHQAQKNGYLCVINTGRPFSHIEPVVKEIGFDGYICSCGQHIRLGDQSVFYDTFSPELCALFIQTVRDCGLDAAYESENGIWFDPKPVTRREILSSKDRFAARGFGVHQDVDGITFDKFCVWTNPSCDRDRFLDVVRPHCSVIDRDGDLLELVKLGCSKSTGIQFVADHFQVSADCCYGIGDSTNDIPMLQAVGHCIAMGNSPEALKQMAEFVTSDIDHHGIQVALRHYGLIE